MMPNYEEMMKKQQESYQRSRNPFEYGQQVARRRYSEIMSGLDAQRMSTQQSYGDLYQQARQRAVGQQAMGGPTLSGGMGQQRRDFISALEMQELGKIGTAREQAMRDLYTQGQAAFSNAQLEGQQAAQQELSNRAAQLQLVQQRQAIEADKNLSEAQKAQQLAALSGQNPEDISLEEKQRGFDDFLISAGGTVGVGGALTVGAAKLGTSIASGSVGIGLAKGFGSLGAGFAGAKAAAVAGGAGKVGAIVAASMATNPVGWAIGLGAVLLIGGGLLIKALS